MGTTSTLVDLSTHLADIVETMAASVIQVQGGRRPSSGVVYAADTILTTTRGLGREESPIVRTPDGRSVRTELSGWDPATGLAVLKGPELGLEPAAIAELPVRTGELALAIGRSWSNAITASAGLVAVIGGPLKTGRGQSIEQIIRTTAPMHSGFAGGAFVTAGGRLAGVATAASIRGLGVVIPASIAWETAAAVLQHGRPRLGYLGVGGQTVGLDRRQQAVAGRERAVLVVGVSPDSPADAAGVLTGDCLLELDGHPIASPDELLGLLVGARVGQTVVLRVIRGGVIVDLQVTVGERRPA
ncbi:MAG TPA: trypsin-like peptidase domain-containing protein [Vicinamibacterales bacterium]|nr:trypsin-like peptidase domain-containing protein [Vicinamibacterales bacterium]